MERAEYIKNILSQHLLQRDTYKQLSKDEAEDALKEQRERGIELLIKHRRVIDKNERIYFNRCIYLPGFDRIPQFYGMPKIHKEKIPEAKALIHDYE